MSASFPAPSSAPSAASVTTALRDTPTDVTPHTVHHHWLRLDASGRICGTSRSFAERFGNWLERLPDGSLSTLLARAGVREGGRLRWAHALAEALPCPALELRPPEDADCASSLRMDIEPELDLDGRLQGFLAQVRESSAVDATAVQKAPTEWLARWYEAARHDLSVGHFVRPLDGSPGFWDEGMFRLFGLRPAGQVPSFDEVVECVTPASLPALLEARRLADHDLRPQQSHYEVQDDDGTTRWVQSNWIVKHADDGRLCVFGSLRDVTALVRQRYEAQLQREQLLLAADAARIGLIREDFATGMCTTNRVAREMFGLRDGHAPVSNREFVDRIHRDDQGIAQVARAAARAGADDAGGEIRYRVEAAPGRITHVRSRRRVILDDAGLPSEMVTVLVDDTAQVQAAARERALAERHEMALDLGGLGQWHWSAAAPLHYEFDRRQCAIYGLGPTASQMSLQNWTASVHPADREGLRRHWDQVARSDVERGRAAFRIVRPDGELRWVQISYAVQGRRGEPPVRVHGTTQDVTERERLLAALREERLALQRSQALAGVGSAWRHLESGAGAWSPQMFAINRRDPALPTPTSAEALAYLPNPAREQHLAAVRESQRTGKPYQMEYAVARDDGTRGWVRLWGVVESDESGRRVMHRYCAQDITEQHALQRSTEAARDRLQALFDNALNAIVVFDDEGRVSELNPAACELLGDRREALLGRHIVEFGEAIGPQSLLEQWQPFRESGRAGGQVRLHVGSGGDERFADFVATAHVQPGTHLCMLMDVTARVMAERRLAQLAARQREDFEALQAEVSRDVHDQLGQVLSALAYETDALVARDPDLRVMRTLVQRAVATSRDISRALRPPVLDLGLPEVLRMLARESSMIGDVMVEVHLPADPPACDTATTHAVYRIVQEALSNVLRHADAAWSSITMHADDDALEVTVEDDGRGIDVHRLAASPGLGVLGMVERARALGGRLDLQRRPAGGTCVRLWLPRGTARTME